MSCDCYFCDKGLEHRHSIEYRWNEISHRLTKAESLDPAHSVRRFACDLCGHVEER